MKRFIPLTSIILLIGLSLEAQVQQYTAYTVANNIRVNTNRNLSTNSVYGITLCGAEFGENNLPGILNKHYTYPNNSEINYFTSKGTKIIQLPFKWERIQHTLGGNLDETELSLISKFVDECATKNAMVILVMQNFGRYKINNQELILGSKELPNYYFYDVWRKLAAALKNKSNLYAFNIMNEPHDMGFNKWYLAAQVAINGIREYNNKTAIIIDGDNYANPENWVRYSDYLKFLKDPSDNIMYSAHCYFDEDRSGRYAKSYESSGANPMTGVERIKPFIDWCNANNKKAFVGEFGIPKTDDRWFPVLENFLNYLADNNIGGCYWAAGPWWKNYSLSIEPNNNQDQPQMDIYAKYLNVGFFNNSTATSGISNLRAKTTTAAR